MKIARLQNCDQKITFQKTVEGSASDFQVGSKANTPELQKAINKKVVPLLGERSLKFTKGAEYIVLPIRDILEKLAKGYNVHINECADDASKNSYKISVGSGPKKSNAFKNFFNNLLGAKSRVVSKVVVLNTAESADVAQVNLLKDTIDALKECIKEHDSKIEYTKLSKLFRK